LFAVLACGVLTAAILNVLGAYGAEAIEATRVQIVADAAALAGVRLGEEGARHLATVNGGELLALRDSGSVVEVRVRMGSHEAVAYASEAP